MLPYNAIATEPRQARYLEPDLRDVLHDASLELGGVALNDPSQGRQVQVWRAWVNTLGTQVLIAPEETPEAAVVLITGVGITDCSVAFDSNMQPAVVYTEGGVVKFRWFDTVSSSYVVTTYPGATSAKVSTDDKRQAQEGASDVILAYVRDDVLYWRQQRDRYTVERVVGPARGLPLRRVGMTVENRLQFELRENLA